MGTNANKTGKGWKYGQRVLRPTKGGEIECRGVKGGNIVTRPQDGPHWEGKESAAKDVHRVLAVTGNTKKARGDWRGKR